MDLDSKNNIDFNLIKIRNFSRELHSLIYQGNLEAALEKLTYYTLNEKLVDISSPVSLWQDTGLYYLEKGYYNKSEMLYKQMLVCFEKLDPDYKRLERSLAYYNLGLSLFYQKKYNEAIIKFTKAFNDGVKFLGQKKAEEKPAYKAIAMCQEFIVPQGCHETKTSREIFNFITDREEKIKERYNLKRKVSKRSNWNNMFMVMRRWNSATPLLPNSPATARGKGGGYFLMHEGKGIVIDPGIGFVEILWEMGLSVVDIDMIIITHDHIDHIFALDQILAIHYEVNDHRRNSPEKLPDHNIYCIGSIGVINKYRHLFESHRNRIIYDYLLPFQKINCQSFLGINTLDIDITPANHRDLWVSSDTLCTSVGLLFNFKNNGNIFKLGFTGDTGPFKDLFEKDKKNPYHNVDLLVTHLGYFSLIRESKYHLGKKHCVNLINSIKPKDEPILCILSEFGEEIGNYRTYIADNIEKEIQSTTCKSRRVIPADIGLKVKIPDCSIEVSDQSFEFLPYQYIKAEIDQKSEQIKYYHEMETDTVAHKKELISLP